MTQERLHRLSYVAVCAIVVLLSSATAARAQVNFTPPPATEAQSAAVKASPNLVNGLAKELGSTPEQAAGAAGVIFGIAKSLLKPEDFAAMSKAVPGMDALLAAVPPDVVGTSGASPTLLAPTPGFAASSSATLPSATAPSSSAVPSSSAASSTPAMNMSPLEAISALSKMGIKPEMMAKAVPFLSGFLKKNGSAALGSLLGGLFKTGK